MNCKNTICMIFLTALVMFSAGCTTYNRDSSYTLRFSINETGEPLDGDVINNNIRIGHAQNGVFSTHIEKLRPGLITLNGTYEDQQFEIFFEFPMESLNYSGTNYSISTDNLRKYIFNVSILDIPQLEHAVFDLVNRERKASGIKELKWNDRIALIAENYSRTLSIEGFHHKDIEGKDAGDRLKENKIFYRVAGENLYMIEGLNGSINISESAVNGWLESPAHRSPIMDRDELYSDSAVGMYCEKKACYAVMVFVGLEYNQKVVLNPDYLTFIYLYDPSYPFDFDVPVSVEIDSTENVNIYFVPNKEQYDNFLQNGNVGSTFEKRHTQRLSRKVVAGKGQGIIIQSAGNKAEINVHLRYT